MLKQPMQPLIVDAAGTVRFKENLLVKFMLNAGNIDMNMLAVLPNIPQEDRAQFAQLIGYSVEGFLELDLVSEMQATVLEHRAQQLRQNVVWEEVASYKRR